MDVSRRIQTASLGPFLSFQHLSANSVCVAVLQLDGMGAPPSIALSTDRGVSDQDWPLHMALRLDAALKEQSRLAVFAAVAASPDRVSVCTAGDIRVHLGWDGRLQATTQDHTYATDPLFAAEANAIPPAVRANVATRGIGDGAKAPPEGGHWDVPGPYTVLVCSSRVHRRRPPPEYFAEVVENLRSPRFEVAGFACSIRFGD